MSKSIKLAKRTSDFIKAFEKDGANAKLGKVDITQSPWHEGYQNSLLQKSPDALISSDELKRGKILEGCGTWEYHVPESDTSNAVIVKQSDDKRRIPRKYKDSATYVVSMDKLKEKFGDNHMNVYYNLQDKAAILAQPEDVIDKSFQRFVKSQEKEVREMFADKPAEWQDSLVSAMKKQYQADFKSGQYLNYSEDIIGQFPGGVALEEKKKAHIKEAKDNRKEKAGLDNNVISYAMGGSANSKVVKDAGIFLVTYKQGEGIADLLRRNANDITEYAEELMGTAEEGRSQKVFVSKEVVDEKGNASVAVLYDGFHSENEGEIEAAVKRATNDTLPFNSTAEIGDKTYSALESQVANAKERYTENTGTWVNSKKPIKVATLDETLLSEQQMSNEKQMGE